ncbi:hypothetical protein GCM10009555_046930 [Acrocarpospora macrocephala]|uniref:Knr4/Smi1-like domain-containing protein n=1 Tax=Acrocarpospora macrocephala TaxID=150177 RepID=A0A5M3WRS8_9ACTN|nr:SMI1/KNR4 family protein [Acrocarpospora macrocephala]GES12035.1 hypothetical protein Amac_056320 [Acrocarpospora macrocephala]
MNAPDTFRYPWAERLRTAYAGPDALPYPPDWVGMDPASEAEIRRHEERLGRRLPPSYREFLQVSNGWDEQSSTSLHLLPIAEVGWTRDVDPHLAKWGPPPGTPIREMPSDYFFDYDAPQDPDYFEVGDHIPHTLHISEDVEGLIYLLDPYVVTSGGEWEAWFLDTTSAIGGRRFRSFWHLMENTFRGHPS